MAETDNQTTEPQEPTAPAAPAAAGEPQEPPEGYLSKEQADALVKSRIDKQNAKHAKELADLQERLAAAESARDEAQAAAAEADAARERAAEVERAAAAAGVPAKVLAAMAGDTAEAIAANAELLAASMPKAAWPDVPDKGGSGAAGGMTVEDIEAIEDPRERVRARAENIGLYK